MAAGNALRWRLTTRIVGQLGACPVPEKNLGRTVPDPTLFERRRPLIQDWGGPSARRRGSSET